MVDGGVLDTCGTKKFAGTDLEWGGPMCICADIEHQAPITRAACWDKIQGFEYGLHPAKTCMILRLYIWHRRFRLPYLDCCLSAQIRVL